MIEFLVMAFFLAQPAAPAAAAPKGTPDAGTPAAGAPAGTPPAAGTALGPMNLRNPVEITSRLITGERKQATFTGDVQVKHRTLDLRCDNMVAYYNQPREVTRVVCTGNVRAVDEDRMARGERADYDVPTGVLVVTGSPEARQGNTYVTGTKVRLTLGSERLEVENARILVESPAGTPTTGTPGAKKRGSTAPTAPGTPPKGGTSK